MKYFSAMRVAAFRHIIAIGVVATLLASCTSHGDSSTASDQPAEQTATVAMPNQPKLTGGEPSAEEVVTAALKAFAERDTARLRQLAISTKEFETYVYPEYSIHYPAAIDTSVSARQFIWEMHSLNSAKGLSKGLREFGGRTMELVSLDFTDSARHFRTYTIHEGTRPMVRLENGTETELEAIGSIIEMDGVYKLLSYRSRED